MCYNNCPYAGSHSGECSNPLKNSKNLDAHCNDDVECKGCGCAIAEDENEGETNLCPDCFIAWEMTQCDTCKDYYEKMEFENGLCPECYDTKIDSIADIRTDGKTMQGNL